MRFRKGQLQTSVCVYGDKSDDESNVLVAYTLASMLEEMNKMNDEIASLREHKRVLTAKLRQSEGRGGPQSSAR